MRRRLAILVPALMALAPAAASAQAPGAIDIPTAEGYGVHVEFTEAAGGVNAELAGTYVAYLDSLPHGPELADLHLEVAAQSQVAGLCGGVESEGILACYNALQQRMIVPAVSLDATTSDGAYSLRYVLTHEYGHHIARHRSNAGFRGGALAWGPKLWASSELVCAQAHAGQLFPGDEDRDYRANPGEAWAEAYARLAFPEQPWNFTPRLTPDPASLDAARRDVVAPWQGNRTATFTMAAGTRRQRFDIALTLDGSVTARIRGPRRSEVGLRVREGSRSLGASHHKGRTDSFRRTPTCRSAPTQTLSFTATRRGGRRGPVTVSVSYPG
jgi:hypothetical protein